MILGISPIFFILSLQIEVFSLYYTVFSNVLSGSTDNRVSSFAYYYDESDSNDKGIVVVVKTTNND